MCALLMGAGRLTAEQAVDHAVGIELFAKPGTAVKRGAPLARMHLRAPLLDVADRLGRAFHLAARAPRVVPLVLERITARSR